jgi:predicted enzyme related to lactoylglutathione lyase
MPTLRGKFIWYDVMTTDTRAATAFYTDVIGWDAHEQELADGPRLHGLHQRRDDGCRPDGDTRGVTGGGCHALMVRLYRDGRCRRRCRARVGSGR